MIFDLIVIIFLSFRNFSFYYSPTAMADSNDPLAPKVSFQKHNIAILCQHNPHQRNRATHFTRLTI